MADAVESEETVTTTDKEPVKNEESTTSTSNTDERNETNSPPPNCSICLGKLVNTSFTDSCLHQFCFTCLLQWSRIKTECPLCKQTFKSIIHNVRSEEDYDQYHVPRDLQPQPPSSQMFSAIAVNFAVQRAPRDMRRFAYRTTMLPNRVLEIRLNSDQLPRQDSIPNVLAPIAHEERRYRRANPVSYRRNIYRNGEWSNPVTNIYSRFRECSADYYRRNPRELDRLIPWIDRDIFILLNGNQLRMASVMGLILDILPRFDLRSPEFYDRIRPYFTVLTHHFIHELMNFARSDLSISDYDTFVTYSPGNPNRGLTGGYWNRVQSPTSSSNSTSSTTDDSDVRVVDHIDNANSEMSRTNIEMLGVSPTYVGLSLPGPSTVSETFSVNNNNNNNNNNNYNSNNIAITSTGAIAQSPCVLTILSSSSSDSDECEVVGYVKPRHERTPEIIELVSSDDEGIVANENIDELESSPKTSQATPFNDEMPCTSNANVERINTRNNQKPKTNNLKSYYLAQSVSSCESTINSESESDSDYVLRSSQKHKSGRNVKHSAKKSDRESSRKARRKRNKNSTSDSVDNKRETKKRRNSNKGSWGEREKNTTICSSSSEDENINKESRWRKLKIRKDLMTNDRSRIIRSSSASSNNSNSSNSSNSSSSSSSSTSSSTTSSNASFVGSSANLRCNNNLKNDKTSKKSKSTRRSDEDDLKCNSSQSEVAHDDSKNEQTRPKLRSTVVKCQRPVNSTLLRKDVDKKEWYIDNNRQSRSRSRSRSSYDSHGSTSRNNSRRRGYHRRRSTSNNSTDNNRKRRLALRIASERLKNQSLYSTADSQNDEDDDDDKDRNYTCPNSQSISTSRRSSNVTRNDKHSKYNKKVYNKESKNGNDEESLDVASTSTSTQKYFDTKNSSNGNKRNSCNNNKIHKKSNKDSKQRRMSSSHSKPKVKRHNKLHAILSYDESSSLSSSSSSSPTSTSS